MTYRDPVHAVPYDFTNFTLVLKGERKITGIDSFSAEFTNPRVTIGEVTDGTAQFVEGNSRVGTVTLSVAEADSSNAYLWDLDETKEIFTLDAFDATVENLKVTGSFRIGTTPPIVRDKEMPVVEWVLECPYMYSKGGSFKLQS